MRKKIKVTSKKDQVVDTMYQNAIKEIEQSVVHKKYDRKRKINEDYAIFFPKSLKKRKNSARKCIFKKCL